MSPHAQETELLATLFEGKVQAELTSLAHSASHAVVLKESGVDAKLKKLTIDHLDSHALVLLLENGRTKDHRYTELFTMIQGWTHHQTCDAILFLHWKKRDYVIYIEMKSCSTQGCDKQFEAAEHFMDYAFRVLEWQKKHQRLHRDHRRVVFNTAKTTVQTLNKLPVNPRNAQAHAIIYIRVGKDAVVTPADFC